MKMKELEPYLVDFIKANKVFIDWEGGGGANRLKLGCKFSKRRKNLCIFGKISDEEDAR